MCSLWIAWRPKYISDIVWGNEHMTAKTMPARHYKPNTWARIKRGRWLYAMLLLPVVYYVLFHYMPMYGVTIAFKQFNARLGIMGSKWVGFKWFEKFLGDEYFWQVLKNTLLLNVYDLVFGFPAPIILALLLNELRIPRFKRLIQTVSYLPHFLSTMVVCGMLSNFLSRNGLINDLIVLLGGERSAVLNNPSLFRTVFVSSGIWQGVGWGAIIYLAALSGVNPELYEVAVLDGANRWQQMLYVTLPGIIGTISIMLILRCGGMLGSNTDKVLLLYNGNTMQVADVLGTYVYRRGLVDNSFSYSTAVGLFSSLVNIILLVSVNKISNKLSQAGLW
jgi:putative aldouronate transport system permease protein